MPGCIKEKLNKMTEHAQAIDFVQGHTYRLNRTYRSPILPMKSATRTAAQRDFGTSKGSFGGVYEAKVRKHLGNNDYHDYDCTQT